MHGAKNGCNLLTGQKAAKAGWIVFDSGRSGGGPIQAIGKKITWRWRANRGYLQKKGRGHWRRGGKRGNLQKCAMPEAQKHAIQAAKSGVIQNPPKFDLRGI